MKVTLTGANGFIGSHIVAELQAHGHDVTALVRGTAQADAAADRGAAAVVTDLYDRSAVTRQFAGADAAIHTAGPNDETSPAMDAAVADAAIDAFAGTGKPYLHIGVLQIYGPATSITEDSPMSPPPLVAWRLPVEQRVMAATGMRGLVIESSVAYGDGGGGLPGLLLGSPRDEAGNLVMLGTGGQRWPTVHVADLADLFRRALESESARGRYIAGDGLNPTVAELTEAAAVAAGSPGAVPGSEEEARARLGDHLAEVVLIDQATRASRARAELGWTPSRPGLVEEFRDGSYREVETD
jgi:nucleoside-diphosphate-sugar epimerase